MWQQNNARRAGARSMAAPRGTRAMPSVREERKRIEEVLRLAEDDLPDAQGSHKGVCRVDWIFTFACAAYNLVRMRNLVQLPVALLGSTCVWSSTELSTKEAKNAESEALRHF
jgi:hypothetical protein